MIKAAKDADLRTNFYTYYAGTTGVPTAMGAAGAERVKSVSYWTPNSEKYTPKGQFELNKGIVDSYKKKFNDDFYTMATYSVVAAFSKAIKDSKSTDPVKVAYAMEGMKFQSLNGEVEMRKSDHQLQQPLFITTWTKTDGKEIRWDQENTGYGWRIDQKIEPFVATQPTSCQMTRPSRL